MPSINGITSLGVVTNETYIKRNNLFTLQLPLSDLQISSGLLGKGMAIQLRGIFVGTTTQIDTFIDSVNSWADASNVATRTYTDSFSNTYSVKLDDWQWSRNEGTPEHIEWSMTLQKADTL